MDSGTRHVSGSMKQQNKSHKSRFRSKSERDGSKQGRLAQYKAHGKNRAAMNRDARRLQSKQVRANKHEKMRQAKRSIGTEAGPPLLIAVMAQQGDGSAAIETAQRLFEAAGGAADALGDFNVPSTVFNARLKQRIAIVPVARDVASVLHFARVANTMVMVNYRDSALDDLGERILACLFAQGVPTTAHIVVGLDGMPVKRRNEAQRRAAKAATDRLPDTRVEAMTKPSDAQTILWHLASQKRRPVRWRDIRSHIVADGVEWNEESQQLQVRGYVRSAPLNVNTLVHIPGVGARQLERVEIVELPKHRPSRNASEPLNDVDMSSTTLTPTVEQHSLVSEVEVSPFEGEQTMPTEDEIASAENEQARRLVQQQLEPKVIRVPKGWSDYQAAWLGDEALVDNEDNMADGLDDTTLPNFAPNDDGMSDDDADMDGSASNSNGGMDWSNVRRVRFADETEDRNALAQGLLSRDDEYDEIVLNNPSAAAEYDAEMDVDADRKELHLWRRAAEEDREFPDEVDTPLNTPASLRFSKYRGLASFKHSEWDPREELPSDYARIFKFKDFAATRRRVLHELEANEFDEDLAPLVAHPGTYVHVVVRDVSRECYEALTPAATRLPFVLWSLIEHENKMSVVNFAIKVGADVQTALKSKEPLIFDTGVRSFVCRPIFSQHSTQTKHKFERFAQPGTVVVASALVPITYPPMPALVYRRRPSGDLALVATGSVLSVNPDRLAIKRVRLSGHPFKINKRSATVRYMFFNPDDIAWFKPVELATKYGRRGHIKESLGTHGHMKCIFDKPLKPDDTVMMNLYKRVYPKWSHEEASISAGAIASPEAAATAAEAMEL